MKAETLRDKSVEELTKLLTETGREQFNLRMQKAGGQLDKTYLIKRARRNVAKIKTILQQKSNVGEKVQDKKA